MQLKGAAQITCEIPSSFRRELVTPFCKRYGLLCFKSLWHSACDHWEECHACSHERLFGGRRKEAVRCS